MLRQDVICLEYSGAFPVLVSTPSDSFPPVRHPQHKDYTAVDAVYPDNSRSAMSWSPYKQEGGVKAARG
jgi:hypothetical protein